MTAENKIKHIRLAAIIAISGNALLATLKLVAGFFSGSAALIGAGIDSSTDILISIITLVIVKVMSKPADAEHPWGHGRAETVATALLAFIIFFAGAQLMVTAVNNLRGEVTDFAPSTFAIVVSAISIAGKLALAFTQHQLGKRADSAMVKANAKNMASDVLISLGVMAGLIISTLTGAAYADSIIALLIGAWIIKTAIGIFLEANLELMDGNTDMEKYHFVMEAVNAVEGATNPHRLRMRRIAGFWDIDLDIEVDPTLTVADAHHIAGQVEEEIKKRLENVFDIVIHVEPCGDGTVEAYGLSAGEIKRTRS
ncbi:MAG: cation diffusion facilitator family transporter [Defluviitaleaceae bacterium]|nr:cation diffusion facilitator family transporter [Defluviitaleaceae bacterium]